MRSPCVSHPITEPQIDDNYELLCRLWSPVVGAEEGGAVARGFQRVKTDKSPGPDTILPRVLYKCRFELVNPLYVLFRACCEQSKIPSEWKKANVIPIYKKGKKSDPSNYRPISLTSTVCKLYESIIKDQILHFFTVNDKISSSQFGFLSGKSCA